MRTPFHPILEGRLAHAFDRYGHTVVTISNIFHSTQKENSSRRKDPHEQSGLLKLMDKRQWIVYLVRCSDESLYCGITNNLKNRLIAHNSGRGAKYTRSRRPVELLGASSAMTKSDALKLEYRVKHVPADRKYFELIKEENEMTMQLKKELQAISEELKAISKKIEKIADIYLKYLIF